jgi:energy-coupling factor transporter transmembrane protein EcfT
MPFIGYILLLQDEVARFISPFTGMGVNSEIKLGIGFYLLYFGLFLFGLGSFIFQVTSPEIAKRFNSADDYVERAQSIVTASELSQKLQFILQHVELGSVVEEEAKLYKNAISAGVGNQPQQAAKLFTLRNFFEAKDRSRCAFRIIVFSLFSSGLALTMAPSFIALAHVGRDFLRSYM